MTITPNRLPNFIISGGFIGVPVSLTSQVCTRDSPGNVPIMLYDSTSSVYPLGNGAVAENLIISPTGAVAKSTLLLFMKIDGSATWLYHDEVDLPALSTQSATTKPSGYPLRAQLSEVIYSPTPNIGTDQGVRATRINDPSRSLQLGVALGTAIGSLPLIVYLKGGDY